MRMREGAQTSRQTALLTYLVLVVVREREREQESERITNECMCIYICVYYSKECVKE